MTDKISNTPKLVNVYIMVLIVILAVSIISNFFSSQNPIPKAQPEEKAPPTQTMQQGSNKTTVLSFTPDSTATEPLTKIVGDTVTLELMVDPGQNLVSFIKMDIEYDPTKLAPIKNNAFQADEALPSVLEGPNYYPGRISVTLSIGADPTKALSQPAKAATVSFKTIAKTEPGVPTLVNFGGGTSILSLAPQNNASDNVFRSSKPASIVIK